MGHKNSPPPPPSRPRPLLRYALIASAALANLAVARARFIRVVSLENGQTRLGRYALSEERVDHPRLVLLRRRERLDEVAAAGKTQFEKIVLLRGWAHAQWKEGAVFYYPPWDAVEILDLARHANNHAFCAQYAIVFLQACRSLGLHARYVDLGHFLAAVWSDEHDKWVIMDPTNDVHYELDGKPLGGGQLRAAAWSPRPPPIVKVDSRGRKTEATREELDAFKVYSIGLRSNQLSDPESISVNGTRTKLTHKDDYRAYPVLGRDSIGYGDAYLEWRPDGVVGNPAHAYATEDPDDLRMPFNQTLIYPGTTDPDKGLIKIKLIAEQTPDLAGFEVKSARSAWLESKDTVVLALRPGMNELSARVKTQAGWTGPASTLKVYYKTNWLGK